MANLLVNHEWIIQAGPFSLLEAEQRLTACHGKPLYKDPLQNAVGTLTVWVNPRRLYTEKNSTPHSHECEGATNTPF